jgi:hypothetical protein
MRTLVQKINSLIINIVGIIIMNFQKYLKIYLFIFLGYKDKRKRKKGKPHNGRTPSSSPFTLPFCNPRHQWSYGAAATLPLPGALSSPSLPL